MKKYDVSIIVPSYNHSFYVEKTILSILLNSTKHSIQLIVIDDFSNDDSVSIIENLLVSNDFLFIKNEMNIGLNNTLSKALSYVESNYVIVNASDDLFVEGRLDVQLGYMMDNNEVDACYGNCNFIDCNDNFIGKSNLYDFNKQLAISQRKAFEFSCVDDTSSPLLQSCIMKTSVFRDMEFLRNKFKSDDWVILLELLNNYTVGFIEDPMFNYRLHDSNSHSNYEKMFFYRLDVITNYIGYYSFKLAKKSLSNLFLSFSKSLFSDKKFIQFLKYFTISLILDFPFKKISIFIKRKINFV